MPPGRYPIMGQSPVQKENHQRDIKALFLALVNQAKMKNTHPGFRVQGSRVGVADEGNYVPQAWAGMRDQTSPRSGTMYVNPEAPPSGSPPYDTFVVAHELGHIGQNQYIRNRTGADQYLEQAGFNQDPRAPYLSPSIQGRAEKHMTALKRDSNGMPTEGTIGGRASTHTAPIEQYATDFAQALGGYARMNHLNVSSMTPSTRRRIARMQEMLLLPQRSPRPRIRKAESPRLGGGSSVGSPSGQGGNG